MPYYQAIQRPTADSSLNVPGIFNWNKLGSQRDSYPHIALLAKTGGGKSTLAQWLVETLTRPGERVIVVAPHWQKGDFPTADVIIGAGRKYGSDARPYKETHLKNGTSKVEGEPEVEFSQCLENGGSVTVCQFMNALVREMNERYQLNPDGVFRYHAEKRPPLTIILDEYPAYSNKPGMGDCLKLLIREARKVGIRLVVLAQGWEVKTLGIEGEGSLRENLTLIYLSNWAIDEARAQQAKCKSGTPEWSWWENIIYKFKQDGVRPAMIDGTPAFVPDLTKRLNDSHWQSAFELCLKDSHLHNKDANVIGPLLLASAHGQASIADVLTQFPNITTPIKVKWGMKYLEYLGYGTFDEGAGTFTLNGRYDPALVQAVLEYVTKSGYDTCKHISDRLSARTGWKIKPTIEAIIDIFYVLEGEGLGKVERLKNGNVAFRMEKV
jgi:hypothetical protein